MTDVSGTIVVCGAVLLLLSGFAALTGGRSPRDGGDGDATAGDTGGGTPWAGSDGGPSRGGGGGSRAGGGGNGGD
ncbi:hypothetical protein [Streptomyces somaliensis]|uniref:hypothetical protein n=1 Tax=Streptomyces somaliensis TaxID=78355 RepID=UPI0034E94A56|nr:hypothetical protein [Streptomyces somaliensis]